MKALVTSMIVLLSIVFGGLWYMERLENPTYSFSTLAEVEEAGLIAGGWIPQFLPRSAHEIEGTHDIDTNRVTASFKYDITDTDSVETACEQVSHDEEGSMYLCRDVPAGSALLFLGEDGHATYWSPADDV